jgi:hypothetical protein
MKTAWIVCLLSATILLATPRGTTQREIPGGRAIQDPAMTTTQTATPARTVISTTDDREWVTADSANLKLNLPAGQHFGWQFHSGNATVSTLTLMDPLTSAAMQALDKAPQWMRADLDWTFRQLNTTDQNTWAAIINDAQDPYIDEIAFCVAHTSPVYLASQYAFPGLFLQNVQWMYQADQSLQYVTIEDYGSSTTDPNYYSTTRYQTVDESGATVDVEAPRDIYYWYIVQPKITDDIPAYIDPAIVEENGSHVNNIAAPPAGRFWRDMFFNEADEGYPILSESLAEQTVLWRRDGQPGFAIQAVTDWVNATMEFTSGSERPHQPVRIYRKHVGRCGEHADITAAAARTALIPCTSILAMSNDHTWNEFWDVDWVHWEPVNGYINCPLSYEGWGWTLGSAFEIRSDGFLTPVSQRYSAGLAHITIHVVDAAGHPVDGARIILAIVNGTDAVSDMVGFTDATGSYTFPVGEGHEYAALAQTALGDYPVDDTYGIVVEMAADGGTYNSQFQVAGTIAGAVATEVDPPADPTPDWRIAVDADAVADVVSGIVTWDDIDYVGTRPVFLYTTENPGAFNLFAGTPDDYLISQLPDAFSAFICETNCASTDAIFDIPADQDWALWLDHSGFLNDPVQIDGMLRLQHFGPLSVEDPAPASTNGLTLRIGPNPMRSAGTIAFSIPARGWVKLDLYDLRGRHVAKLTDGAQTPGAHTIAWGGTDDHGAPVASGVYFCRLTAGGHEAVSKLLMLR